MTPASARKVPMATFLAGALSLAVLTAPLAVADGRAASSRTAGAGRPTLTWGNCHDPALTSIRCATLVVPLDWEHPGAGTIEIAMARHRSTGTRAQRIGSLFFNPGGPGGSGVGSAPAIWQLLPSRVKRHFDLVSWDPRGVGRSSGLEDCVSGVLDPPDTGSVDWKAVVADYRESQAAANRRCRQRHPDIVDRVGTRAVVRDLDAMRAAVGDRKLTYWGLSYGTRIGYTYALTYPRRLRAILLDGSINPNGSIADFAEAYGTAADSALGMFFQMYPGTSRQYQRALRRLGDRPLRLPSGEQITRWNLHDLLEVSAGMERLGTESWPVLAQDLSTVSTALFGHGRKARSAKRALDKTTWTTSFTGVGGTPALIDCIDYADRPDARDQYRLARQTRKQAPISGWHNGVTMAAQCEGIDVTPDPVPTDFGTNRSARMLLFGTTRDARTPYVWTAAMARAFRASRVVTYDGGQHGDYLLPESACMNRYANRYFIHRTLPRKDQLCPQVG